MLSSRLTITLLPISPIISVLLAITLLLRRNIGRWWVIGSLLLVTVLRGTVGVLLIRSSSLLLLLHRSYLLLRGILFLLLLFLLRNRTWLLLLYRGLILLLLYRSLVLLDSRSLRRLLHLCGVSRNFWLLFRLRRVRSLSSCSRLGGLASVRESQINLKVLVSSLDHIDNEL